MTFIELHKFLLKNGIDKKNGLCGISKDTGKGVGLGAAGALNINPTFELFQPTSNEKLKLYDTGLSATWWGDDEMEDCGATYGPLRQTIILFCAALEGEL